MEIDIDQYFSFLSNNKGIFIKKWYFRKNNVNYILSFDSLNGWFIKSEHKKCSCEKIQFDSTGYCQGCYFVNTNIFNFNDWIKNNLEFIQNYHNNLLEIQNIVETISKTHLASPTFENSYYVGWFKKSNSECLDIKIDKFDLNNINVTFKNKTNIFNKNDLLKFIEKNNKHFQKLIKQSMVDYENNKNIKNLENLNIQKENLEPITPEQKHLNMLRAGTKMLHTKTTINMYIHKPLAKRFYYQACKPLEIKYDWMSLSD